MVVFVVPHVGIPEDWKVYAYAVSGMILMVVGYSLRQKAYIRSIEKEMVNETQTRLLKMWEHAVRKILH